jgi:hypothetical protein
MLGLSFWTPLAYDYKLAFQAIQAYYPIADEILLAVDRDRISWNNKPFEFDKAEVEDFINWIDGDGKIRVLEGDFHQHSQPRHNEFQERLICTNSLTKGNWIVSIDADEVLLNPVEFREWLLTTNPVDKNVYGYFMTVFKDFGEELLVCDPAETMAIATMLPGEYRATSQSALPSPLWGVHYSWGRSAADLKQKLTNWGHANDFDTEAFFKLWESVTLDNYTEFKDFHPLDKRVWKSLKNVRLRT